MDDAWHVMLERWERWATLTAEARAVLEHAGHEALGRFAVTVDAAWSAAFLARLEQRAGAGNVRWAEDALVLACQQRQRPALAAFDREVLLPAVRAVPSTLLGTSSRDELAQSCREKLLVGLEGAQRLESWSGTRPLGAWVRAVATRLALDHRGSDTVEAEEAREVIERLPVGDDPELAAIKRSQGALIASALRAAAGRLPRRERVVLRLHLFNQLSTDQLGRMFHAHPATVRRWIQGAREMLLDGMRAWLGEQHALTSSQVKSVLLGLHSTIDLSLSALHSHSRT